MKPFQIIHASSKVSKGIYLLGAFLFLSGIPLIFFEDYVILAIAMLVIGVLIQTLARFMDWWQRGLIASNEWH
ncbi:MAG: hypothetical protein WD512_12090 [Candidatus Paceibacterota bacterium]